MASGPYSFIDIAVNEAIRQRFAAGDALVVLDTGLQKVIWANGPGAALLGFPDIETIVGADAGLGLPAKRQISAAPGFPAPDRDVTLVVRLAGRPLAMTLGAMTLPDGMAGLVLAVAAAQAGAREPQEIAARAVAGFTAEAGYFAAIVDAGGSVAAATDGFAELGIEADTLGALVAEVREEDDRLVKRLVPAFQRRVPAAIARLTDDPAVHLLVAVDEGESASNIVHLGAHSAADAAMPSSDENEATGEGDEPSAAMPADHEADNSENIDPTPADPGEEMVRETDHWYFSRNGDGTSLHEADSGMPGDDGPRPQSGVLPTRHERREDAAPVRFVWRTDAGGHFSEVSHDFARAVGIEQDDLLGRHFSAVAAELGFDEDGAIAGLLERRDTWSGRSVSWPIAGTDSSVPVDLAALPVYDRHRNFEGFRGFGVARMADRVASPVRVEAAVPRPKKTTGPQADETDGFRGEVPALTVTPGNKRRSSDKVIQLAERRESVSDSGLSPLERTAFQEIGARLRRDFEASERESRAAETTAPESEPVDATAPEDETAKTPEMEDIDGNARTDALPEDDDGTSDRSPETADIATDGEPDGDGAPDEAANAAPALPLVVRPAPPLRREGFLPSAWASLDRDPVSEAVALIDRLPLAILVHSGDRLDYANRAWLDLTGYDDLDRVRDNGGLDALFVESVPQAADTIGDDDSGLRLRRADGQEIAVNAHLQSVRWAGHSALMMSLRREVTAAEAPMETSATGTDEAERRVAEMRTIIDTATDGIVLIARNGTIRNISRPAEALFGFDSDTVEGKPFATLFAIESQRSARDYLDGLADNGVASVLNDGREVIGREASGGFIPLFMTIGSLPDDGGYCAVLRDITHWKRAEEELTQARGQAERASSQKTEFLARISHEIRTPLNAIIGFSELMMDEKFGPIGSDRYRDYLRDINRSGNHVLDLVNDLLDISKIEAGEQEMNYEAVSLNETLAETIAMMQPQANRERVIIRSSLSSTLPEVVADVRSVRQIGLNLLSNALRYTPAGGQVVVSTIMEPSGDVVMRIRDTGIGMSLGEIDEALKPFRQINAIKSGRHGGTGLGLPLTKAMVEANRARFEILSTPGEGTLVEVTFPSTRVLAN